MLPGGGKTNMDSGENNFGQSKGVVSSPLTIEKRVSDIAGMLHAKASMKDTSGPIKAKQTTGGFFTGQPAKATNNTFYPRKQGS